MPKKSYVKELAEVARAQMMLAHKKRMIAAGEAMMIAAGYVCTNPQEPDAYKREWIKAEVSET